MRALPGIKMTKTGSLWIAKTVYDFPSRSGVGIRGPSETWEIAELRSESR